MNETKCNHKGVALPDAELLELYRNSEKLSREFLRNGSLECEHANAGVCGECVSKYKNMFEDIRMYFAADTAFKGLRALEEGAELFPTEEAYLRAYPKEVNE